MAMRRLGRPNDENPPRSGLPGLHMVSHARLAMARWAGGGQEWQANANPSCPPVHGQRRDLAKKKIFALNDAIAAKTGDKGGNRGVALEGR